MKIQSIDKKEYNLKTIVLTTFLMLILGSFLASACFADTAKEIDVSVDVALKRFYEKVKGAKEFGKVAKGLLVLPNVIKAGFIIGGEYGEGAMRIGEKTIDYYSVAAGSFGLQIGAQKKDIIIAFMTDQALRQFRDSSGWEAGVDGNIALIDIGAGERIDTTTVKDPIVAFVFDVKGLMADISLKGSKFTRLDKSKEE
jgi:lipid-binding SYLF domain-containing protein